MVDRGTELVPVEVKAGATVTRDFFRGLQRWLGLADERAGPAWLIHGGDARQVRAETEVAGWRDLPELARTIA